MGIISFEVEHKAYKISIDDDKEDIVKKEIDKYLDLSKNIEAKELIIAFIKQSYKLVNLDKSLHNLSDFIDKQIN